MSFHPAQMSKRLAQLLEAHEITPPIFAVGQTLLWRCGKPSGNAACVSYDRLAKLAGVARSTVAEAVARLKELGVLSWEKTRIRVAWGFGTASRQWRNIYRWIAGPAPARRTESAARTTDSRQEKKQKRRSEMALNPVRSPAEQIAELGGDGSRALLDERRRRFGLGLVPIQLGSPKAIGDLLRGRREVLKKAWQANQRANR